MSKTKTTQTQNSTQSATSTPTNPEWVTQGAQGLAGNIQSLAGQDPQSFFAGANPVLQQGIDAFSGLGAQGLGWLTQAAGMAGQPGAQVQAAQSGPAALASATSAAAGMGAYQNPYEDQVVQSAMGDMDRARLLTQNSNGQGAIAAGQYGGSRQGVLDRTANSDFIRNVGSTLGNLRMQGFNTAAGLGGQDADRFTSVSATNANAANQMAIQNAQMQQQAALANQASANQGQQFGSQLLAGLGQYGLGGLMDAGGVQQGLDQAQAGAPLTVQQLLSGSYGSLPLGLFNGQNTTGQSSGTGTSKTTGFKLGWSPTGGLSFG